MTMATWGTSARQRLRLLPLYLRVRLPTGSPA
jgi:hypothetical protein